MSSATLHLDGMTVPVETDGTSRRAKLTIERDGSLRLRAAADVEAGELQTFLTSKREWIYKKLAEKEALAYEPVTKELLDGEGFLYLGRSHRLLLSDDHQDRVRLERGRLVLPRCQMADGYQRIIDWYEARGAAWLRPRLNGWASRLHVSPNAIDIADLGHKWGAATSGGRVRVHWATMQLRPPLIDYVLAHELAHLAQPHHGPPFWQLVGRVMPDYDDRKSELARVGASIWLGSSSGARTWLRSVTTDGKA